MTRYTVDSPQFEAELDDEPYQFDIVGVWVRDDGYYMGTDSGCSCPGYWESHTEGDLTGPLTFEQVAEEAESLAFGRKYAMDNIAQMLNDIEAVAS